MVMEFVTQKDIMKQLTILVSVLPAVGHVNACAGALSGLLARGHRVIFMLTKNFEEKLTKQGYEEYIMPTNEELQKKFIFSTEGKSPGAASAELFLAAKIIGPYSPKEKMENMTKMMQQSGTVAFFEHSDKCLRDAIDRFKPDLIYVDGIRMPAILYSGIPWILNISTAPLSQIYNDNLPPGGSGLPTDGDRSEWAEWSELRLGHFKCSHLNDSIEKMGYPRYPNDLYPQTELLNVYAIPDEINYPQFRAKEDWFNIEVFNKSNKSTQKVDSLESVVPKQFLDNDLSLKFSGKLIYLSMGSMGSIDLDLMQRLIEPLAKTNHKYIVSKGPRHSVYELAPNMWGDEFLPQTSILPHVDLVITHGGNNTVTEVFVEGKPMIVLPLFGDQYNNAQRLKETGYGARLDPYEFTEAQLLGAIKQMLENNVLQQKLANASARINATNHHEQLALLIEQKLAEL